MAILSGVVGAAGCLHAEDFEWTYDFSTGNLAGGWNHNINNPAVSFSGYFGGFSHMVYSGTSTFQSSAIHQSGYNLSSGDSIKLNLAWSPFDTVNSLNGNNEVFQLGLMNLTGSSWAKTSDRLATGDSFWLAGREVASTAPAALGEWGTQSLNLWLQTDELTGSILDVDVANALGAISSDALSLGLGLGKLKIDSFRQGSDGSFSAKFLDIDLELTPTDDGAFDYGVEIYSHEWTSIGGMTSWIDEGLIFSATGSRAHQMGSTAALHPTIGFLVADSSQLGVSSSKFATLPAAVPEPASLALGLFGLGLFGLRRRR